MHENMYVFEQGEHHYLLGFVLSSCVHRLHVHAQNLPARVSFLPRGFIPVCVLLCALVCDAGAWMGVYLRSEHVCETDFLTSRFSSTPRNVKP